MYHGWEVAELINVSEFSKLYDWRIYKVEVAMSNNIDKIFM